MSAAWEEDDALAAELQQAPEEVAIEEPAIERPQSRSIITKRTDLGEDPFEDDDRVAQLPNDFFDEPSTDTIPDLDSSRSLDEVESALDREIERRESEIEDRARQQKPRPLVEIESDEPSNEEPLEAELADENVERSQVADPEPQESEFNFETREPEPVESIRPFRSEPSQEILESQKSCEEELASLKADRINSVDLNIRVDGRAGEDFPYECTLGDDQLEPRVWPEITYTWRASALCHKPLYFEQTQLERYGHSWPRCVQPVMSGAHFFGSVAILPYKMGLETPNECIYALGHYRPGSCAPYYIEALPFTWRAAAYQAGTITGLHFALPFTP